MQAPLDTGRSLFKGGGGRWATEQLVRALAEGRPFNAQCLRTNDSLRKDEWIHLDDAIIEEGMVRLRGVADLMAAGLTVPVPDAMGTMLLQWENVTDMNPAEVSLSGVSRTEDDQQDFNIGNLPMPITHKDFNINLRHLAASRKRGESLDTSQARVAGRLVAEQIEYMLFNGGKTFGGNTIYGLTTHPQRNLVSTTTGAWSASGKTGEQILADVLNMITALEGDRMFGPYRLYVPSNYNMKLESDFKANSDKSIRQRLLEVDRLQGIATVDQLAAGHVTLFQATKDVVAIADGETLQSVQWDVEGGFIIKMKAFAIQVPLIRADAQGRCGVAHMNAGT